MEPSEKYTITREDNYKYSRNYQRHLWNLIAQYETSLDNALLALSTSAIAGLWYLSPESGKACLRLLSSISFLFCIIASVLSRYFNLLGADTRGNTLSENIFADQNQLKNRWETPHDWCRHSAVILNVAGYILALLFLASK